MTLPPSVRLAICTVLLLAAPACQPQPAAVNGAAGIGDPYYPLLGNGGYDVQRYTLSLAVDPAANQLDGTATLEADATERLTAFNLDFQGLTVDAITVNGSAAAFSQQAAELTVTPRRPLPADRPFTTVVRYHGQPGPVQSAALDVEVGWFHAADGTINVWSEPDGASTWFPNNNHPRDKATYRFEITVPKPWIVAASGSLKETTEAGGQTRYVWEMDQPMASYLAAIEIDRYDLVTAQGPDGVALRSYFPPDYPQELRQRFDALPEMIAYLSSLFGPYPFKDYGVVIADSETMDCTDGGADEIQTLSIYCPPKYMAEEAFIVHELAHQWFGDSVSLKSWQDMWLKEGMATYVEWLWGTRDLEPAALDRTAHVATIGYFLSRPVGQPRDDFLYDDEVYRGGALVFHALRREVGDDAFFKILRTYLERYRGGVAGTDDFIAVAQEVSGRDLRPLFDAWLYSTKLPSFAP